MSLRDLEAYSPGHWFYDLNDQLKQHLARRSLSAFAEGDALRDAITTPEALAERQVQIRAFICEAVGGLPSSDTPLLPQTVGTLEGDGFTVEKILFQSRPRHYVTANLYLPKGLTEKTGAVLFLSGHHDRAKHEPEYQAVCMRLVKAGLVVLAQDPIGQGERFSYYEASQKGSAVSSGTTEHDYAGAQCLPLGDGIARYFLHDAMRGVDYLVSRPEVDPKRIGVTGNSGGGTQSSLLMMADPRLAAAVPGTFIMNRETYLHTGGAQDAEQIWRGFTAQGFDHEDILIPLAPKPVLVVAVQSDFFPIEGTRRTVERCRRLWGLHGRAEDIGLEEDASTHAYTPHLAHKAAQFFAKHLLGKEIGEELAHIETFPPESLWCTKSGQVRGEIEGAEFVFETNQERIQQIAKQRLEIGRDERLDRARTWLRGRVFSPARKPVTLNPRFYRSLFREGWSVEMAIWRSQEDLFNHAYVFRDFRREGETLPVVLALWDGGTNALRSHYTFLQEQCEAGNAVMVLDASGMGALAPRPFTATPNEDFYGAIHKLADDLIWLDDDLVSLRTFDVLRAVEVIGEWKGLDAHAIQVYAHGREGIYGRLAAFLNPDLQMEAVEGDFRTWSAWASSRFYDRTNIYSMILPEALRYFDLDDLEEEE